MTHLILAMSLITKLRRAELRIKAPWVLDAFCKRERFDSRFPPLFYLAVKQGRSQSSGLIGVAQELRIATENLSGLIAQRQILALWLWGRLDEWKKLGRWVDGTNSGKHHLIDFHKLLLFDIDIQRSNYERMIPFLHLLFFVINKFQSTFFSVLAFFHS